MVGEEGTGEGLLALFSLALLFSPPGLNIVFRERKNK
jgi:hypothetical protein